MAGQVWGVNSLGGYMYSDELSDTLRQALQPMIRFRQFCDAKDAINKGKKKGDTFNWNVYSNIGTQGGELDENLAMPESNFTVTQGSLTVTEYGNSVPFTEKLDNLSKHSVEEVIDKVLKNDAAKCFDTLVFNEFVKSKLIASANADTTIQKVTDGTPANAMAVELQKEHVGLVVDWMKERNIPTYSSGDYYCIARPSTYRTFKTDLEAIHQYTETGLRMIMNGEIGRYEGTRFIEQTHIAKGATGTYGTAGDWAFFFGQDTVAEAIVVPEEIRGKIPTDFGRSHGLAWYYLGGFGLVHEDQAVDARIVRWTSSA